MTRCGSSLQPATALALTALLCVAAPGASSAGERAAKPSVFPAGAELVRLDVVVRAKDGTPVRDLRPGEIEVFEQGQRCDISSFRLVQVEPLADAAGAPVAAASGTSPLPDTGAARGAGEAPAVAASRGDELPTSIVALVFDAFSLDSALRARQAALDMLARRFPPGTWFMVVKIGYGLHVLQPLTTDRSVLPAAIGLATAGLDRPVEAATNPAYENATDEALSALLASGGAGALEATNADAAIAAAQSQMLVFADALQRERRGQGVFYPLLALSRSLAGIQGRKTMLLFSEGLQVTAAHVETMSAAISAANRANVTIYGLDAGGLRVESPFGTTRKALAAGVMGSRRATTSGSTSRAGVRAAQMGFESPYMNAQGNLQNVAESTGGFLVANTNDLRSGLERVAADLRSYYEVAYVPPHPEQDGRWREIKVRVSRPGVHVRSRKGYFAMPPGKPVVRPSELALVVALEQEPLPRAVELRAATIPIAGSGPDRETVVLAEVPVGAARFTLRETPAGQVAHARLSLLGLVRDEKGRLVAKLTHDAPFDGAAADVPALRRQLLVTRRTLTLPAGRYTLEVAAIDRESGRLGARRVPFEVAAGEGLEVGGPTVVDSQPAPGDAGSDDRLRVADRTAVPRLGRAIVAGVDRSLGVYLTLHAPPAATPSVALEIRRDGQLVGRATPELGSPDATGRVAYIGTLPAERFTPGRYELWAIARQGEVEVRQGTGFEVTAPGTARVADRGLAANEPPDVTSLREKAGRYVVEFQEQFRSIVAEETSRQWAGKQHRTLRSDLVFVTFPGAVPWATFRDVYEVDGQAIRGREGRLEALLARADRGALEQALALARESARYNLGPLYRTVNVPTLALTFLHPDHQWRFRWQRKGKRTFYGHDAVELRAEETARPSLIRGLDDTDVPAKARFWIEEGTGRVLRSEAEFHVAQGLERADVIGWIDTQFRPDSALGLWVPEEMTERHENVRGGRADFDGIIRATARYANHRRFGVDVTEGAARLSGAAPDPQEQR